MTNITVVASELELITNNTPKSAVTIDAYT